MSSRHLLFRILYRLGFTPSDGHPLAKSLREVSAVAAPNARLLLVEFIPNASRGVPGIEPSEVARRFEGAWTLLASGNEPAMDHNGKDPARYYLLQRAS